MECRIYNDSKSALTQCLNDTGPWRTRHLRLRASKIREILREDPKWTAKHLDGKLLVADGLTKALGPQAFQAFRNRMRLGKPMKTREEEGQVSGDLRDGVTATMARVAKTTLRDCGAVLIGGGAALLGGSRHKTLGGLLLACGVAAACVDAQRNKQEPQGRQDPKGTNQESQGQQDPERTPQDPKGTKQDPERTPQDPKGTNQDPERTSQDPKRTNQDPRRTRQDPQGTTPTHANPFPLMVDSRGGSVPGIRAMRNVRKEEGRQHQNAAMDGKPTGAQARGVAAMRQMDGYASSAAAPSSGEAQGQDSGAGEKEHYQVNVKVDVTVELPQGEVHQDVQVPVKPNLKRQGVQEVKRPTGTGLSGWQGSNTEAAQSQEEGELWQHPRFERPEMRSTDCWDLTYVDKGWLLRLHRKPRKRFFHPVHGSLPIDPERLTPERTTIRFELDGSHRQVAHDDWRGKTRTDDGSSWRGYTFFRLGALQSTATASGSTEPAGRPLEVYEETESVESCGSYEMIDPTTGDRP